MTAIFIEETLSHIKPYFKEKGLVEIIFRPGLVQMEDKRGHWTEKKDKNLTLETLSLIAQNMANYSDQVLDDDHPVLSTHLPPPYGYRFHAVRGSSVEGGIVICLRLGNTLHFPLEKYFGSDTAAVRKLIQDGACVLISGGTSSGKTTCLNSLIQEIPKQLRVVSLENMRELSIPHSNATKLVGGDSRGQDLYHVLATSVLRLRPDRIIFGELTPSLTEHFLRLANTGHRGSMTTIHAESPQGALEALRRNLLLKGATDAGLEAYIASTVDAVVQMERGANRKITARYEDLR